MAKPLQKNLSLFFAGRVAGEAYAELFEDFAVDFAQHYGRVHLTAAQTGKHLQGAAAALVAVGEHRQGHQHFIGVEARVVPFEVDCFCVLNRFDHLLRDQFQAVVDAGQMLYGVENQGGART